MTNEADIQPKRLEMHLPRWSSSLLSLGLLAGGGYFLFRWSGGFPPLPWQLLFNTISHFSLLWQARGGAIWLPLALLIVHSLFLLVAWLSFCLCVYAAVLSLFSPSRPRPALHTLAAPVPAPAPAPSAAFRQHIDTISTPDIPRSYASTVLVEEPVPATIPAVDEDQEEVDRDELMYSFDDLFPEPETQREESTATKLVLRTAARSHPGVEKRHMLKEDRLFVQQWPATFRLPQPGGLFVVAACSGPLSSGLEANQQIIQTISDTIIPALGMVQDPERLAQHLLQGIQHAIFTYQLNSSQPTNIAVSVALIMGETAYMFHPGRSLSYLYSTADDQLRTLGHAPTAEPAQGLADEQMLVLPLQAGQCLLLCSDGLWEAVPEQEISGVLRRWWFQPERAVQDLVESALRTGGKDNISAILLSFEREEVKRDDDDDDDDDILADIFQDEG